MTTLEALHERMEPPLRCFAPALLGPEPEEELATVRRLWLECGYRPGIVAYLNFCLLRDFLQTHDEAFAPRFATFRSMAESFQRTDEFVRAVTDSGRTRTGGIGSEGVRRKLGEIMGRHRLLEIPLWMMTYFGYSLVENVERQCQPLQEVDRRRHLNYMARAFRLMGVPFSSDRATMERFARQVEVEHAAPSPALERRARHILLIGEMVGVSSACDSLEPMLPPPTRAVFQSIAGRVRPGPVRRWLARRLGGVVLKRAVGEPG